MGKYNIFRFDITMGYLILMEIFYGSGYLFYLESYLGFGEGFGFLQLGEKSALLHVL